MSTVSKLKKDWESMYDGFDTQAVGLGAIDPSIYSSEEYRKKKQQKILIGGISRIIYAGFENDSSPLILTIGYVPQYNVILAFNLRYVPYKIRKKIIDVVLKQNIPRIKKQQPILIDYHALKAAVPEASKIVRMYKLVGIRVVETFPLNAWGTAIKEDSKWSKHYKKVGKSSETTAQKFFRSVRGFF